ncbi:MAG: hypothetical protein QOH72_5604 [Solirubrobacteraceae bacterium]|nr:hypothetical protein [Solirubrobacteraceae bacterium]
MDPSSEDRGAALDVIEPAEWTAGDDAAVARARAERRRARAHSRRPARDGGLVALRATRSGRLLLGAATLLLLATIVGVVALWPGARPHHGPSQALGGATLPATVARTIDTRCPGPVDQRCRAIDVRLGAGPDRGRTTRITLGPVDSVVAVGRGDRVRVQPTGAPAGTQGAERYAFADVDRHRALLWLTLAFAALVVVLARWRGLLALVGFALSLLLVTRFLVPAILAGSPPLLVALVGSLAVMFVTLGLTYGVAPASLAAVLGIGATLGLAALLAHAWVAIAHLDGRGSEISILLRQQNAGLSLRGVVLAGMVIGALGVLADTGVTQASAVMALRRANPQLGARAVYREAFAVGRDHLTATIHTLVLAYVGASLPLMLILSSANVATGDALNVQEVAEPIVATLVGSIALLASVPLTTGLAALLVARVPPAALAGSHEHAHHHH